MPLLGEFEISGLVLDEVIRCGDDSWQRASKVNDLALISSPHLGFGPRLCPFRFGYTGPHYRRGGTGDRRIRRNADGDCGAAQKMVCP